MSASLKISFQCQWEKRLTRSKTKQDILEWNILPKLS